MQQQLLLLLLGLTLLITETTTAFVVVPSQGAAAATHMTLTSASTASSTTQLAALLDMELQAEPAGGDELTAPTTLPNTRMKQMQLRADKKSSADDKDVYEFWMTAEVEGALIQEIRTQILKDASRKANFPGFRPGQIPPWAQPQITNFSLQEAIMKTVQAAVDAYGITALEGSDGEVTVHEDVSEMTKKYKKIGDSVQFTATLYATYADDSEKQEQDKEQDAKVSAAADGGAVDAEIEAETTSEA